MIDDAIEEFSNFFLVLVADKRSKPVDLALDQAARYDDHADCYSKWRQQQRQVIELHADGEAADAKSYEHQDSDGKHDVRCEQFIDLVPGLQPIILIEEVQARIEELRNQHNEQQELYDYHADVEPVAHEEYHLITFRVGLILLTLLVASNDVLLTEEIRIVHLLVRHLI